MRPSFSMSGVVDLSALKQPARPAGAPDAGAGAGGGAASEAGGGFVVEAGEADFQASVLERSLRVPVVVVFSASWSDQSKQFDAVLARLAEQFAGGFVLARVEAEANPRLVQAMRVPGVPAVLAIVGGELIGQFSGIRPEAEVQQWLTELLAVAQREFGMAPGGAAADAGEAAEAEPPMDPALEAAYTAIEADDLDGAAQALRNVLDQDPGHPEAKPLLARVELMRRNRGADPAAALARVKQEPQSIDARCAAADALLEAGQEDEALGVLLDAVRDFSGDERERARRLLLDYFELLGPQDPRVGKARSRLTSLLF